MIDTLATALLLAALVGAVLATPLVVALRWRIGPGKGRIGPILLDHLALLLGWTSVALMVSGGYVFHILPVEAGGIVRVIIFGGYAIQPWVLLFRTVRWYVAGATVYRPKGDDEDMKLSYDFKFWEEVFWIAAISAILTVLQALVAFDPAEIVDWQTWAVALGGGVIRSVAGALIAHFGSQAAARR